MVAQALAAEGCPAALGEQRLAVGLVVVHEPVQLREGAGMLPVLVGMLVITGS